MKTCEINIRDPFVVYENNICCLYGTRAANFGRKTGGFDVYTSVDLENWSAPTECFSSEKYNLNREVNWAPEVHKYGGSYYMFATFTQDNNLRGTHVLKAESPLGPFVPHSDGAVTPKDWECLDGTLYIENGIPYLVFCHEHTQIIDGTVCYIRLSDDLKHSIGEPTYLFSGSSPFYIDKKADGEHYITDGPFMFRNEKNELLMLWSTFIKDKYAECLVKFEDGTITGKFYHLNPLITDDGGHGMIFRFGNDLILTYHSPNISSSEHPVFLKINNI